MYVPSAGLTKVSITVIIDPVGGAYPEIAVPVWSIADDVAAFTTENVVADPTSTIWYSPVYAAVTLEISTYSPIIKPWSAEVVYVTYPAAGCEVAIAETAAVFVAKSTVTIFDSRGIAMLSMFFSGIAELNAKGLLLVIDKDSHLVPWVPYSKSVSMRATG